MEAYDGYDTSQFSKDEFELLLDLAPLDQLPELTGPEAESDLDGRSDSETASHLKTTIGSISEASLSLEEYILNHQFFLNRHLPHCTRARRRFERNVYDYARAKRFGRKAAREAVQMARVLCGATDDDSDDSSFGREMENNKEDLVRLLGDLHSKQLGDPLLDAIAMTLAQLSSCSTDDTERTSATPLLLETEGRLNGRKRKRRNCENGDVLSASPDSVADPENRQAEHFKLVKKLDVPGYPKEEHSQVEQNYKPTSSNMQADENVRSSKAEQFIESEIGLDRPRLRGGSESMEAKRKKKKSRKSKKSKEGHGKSDKRSTSTHFSGFQ